MSRREQVRRSTAELRAAAAERQRLRAERAAKGERVVSLVVGIDHTEALIERGFLLGNQDDDREQIARGISVFLDRELLNLTREYAPLRDRPSCPSLTRSTDVSNEPQRDRDRVRRTARTTERE